MILNKFENIVVEGKDLLLEANNSNIFTETFEYTTVYASNID